MVLPQKEKKDQRLEKNFLAFDFTHKLLNTEEIFQCVVCINAENFLWNLTRDEFLEKIQFLKGNRQNFAQRQI